ncbi:MAG: response regulator [Bacteroidota bacterium]
MHQYKYLIVDDDELSRLNIEVAASRFPFLRKTASCANALEASELIAAFHPDIVFADIEMPGISGFDLIKSLSVGTIIPVFNQSNLMFDKKQLPGKPEASKRKTFFRNNFSWRCFGNNTLWTDSIFF